MTSFVKKKTCEKDVVEIVTFDLISLLPTNHTLLLILQWHTGVSEETFVVNRKIAQQRNFEIFFFRKSILQEICKLRQLFERFQTLMWKPGQTVQNLESPGFSGRVDSPGSVTLQLRDRRVAASLRYRDRAEISVLVCEQ